MKKLLKLMGLLLLTIFLGACQAQNAATPSNQTAATSSSVTESSSTSTTSTQTKQLLALVILAQTFLMQHRQLFWMVLMF